MWDLGEEQGSRKEEKDLLEDRDQERSKEENGNQRVSEAGIEKGEEDLAHHSKYSMIWSSFLLYCISSQNLQYHLCSLLMLLASSKC